MTQTPNSFPWTTDKIPSQVYRNSWDFRFRTHDPRAAITHLTAEEYRALYLEVFKVTAPAQPKRILDYGCGTGLLVPVVLELWPEAIYSGCDISEEMIHYNYLKMYGNGISFWLVPEAMNHIRRFGPHDFIVCHSVFTHITLGDAKELLRTLHGLLSPGGQMSVSICLDPQQQEDISGDWGRVVYGGISFNKLLQEAGFEILAWFHSDLIGQDFYGVKKKG